MIDVLTLQHRNFLPVSFSRFSRTACRIGLMLALAAGATAGAYAESSSDAPVATAHATSAQDSAARATQRARIEASLRHLDVTYAHAEQACMRRFFVNACLDRAHVVHRHETKVLQSELIAMDLVAREQRATAERRRVARNLQDRQVPAVSAMQQARAKREQQLADKQHAHDASLTEAAARAKKSARGTAQAVVPRPTPLLVVPTAQPPRKPPVMDAQQSAQARAAYANKLADYQRRQRGAAQQRKRAGSAVPALPVPEGY